MTHARSMDADFLRFGNIVAHRTLYESVGMGSYRIYGSLSKADICQAQRRYAGLTRDPVSVKSGVSVRSNWRTCQSKRTHEFPEERPGHYVLLLLLAQFLRPSPLLSL